MTEEQEVIARVRRIANRVAGIEVKIAVLHPPLKPPRKRWARYLAARPLDRSRLLAPDRRCRRP